MLKLGFKKKLNLRLDILECLKEIVWENKILDL